MNKQIMVLMAVMLLSISVIAAVPVSQIGIPVNITVTNPNVAPQVFIGNNSRVLTNDPYGVWANGNISKRSNNYAFTGEQISFTALVIDANGKEDVSQVNGVLSDTQNGAALKQVSCARQSANSTASFVGAPTSFDATTMAVYTCTYTVEPSTHGAMWYSIQATDSSNTNAKAVSQEYWFFNPAMDITINGAVNFGAMQPGQTVASPAITITNNGEGGMGVQFRISGSDFYDSSSSGAMCPTTNQLALTQFKYSATQGNANVVDKSIPYGTTTDVTASKPIIDSLTTSSGSSLALTLKLTMPTPCKGTFTSGNINLWGIAV
jgi:hypothetical protein